MAKKEQVDETPVQADENKIVRNHVLVSMGMGLIPVPMMDIVGITGVQLNMLRKLAKAYQVPFSEHKVKNILSSLIGAGGTIPVAGVFYSFVKMIPVVGQTIGSVSMPIAAGATTYAVGKVFLMHFASGGTFLTFDPEKVKDYYAEMLKEGKTVAAGMKA
jgi:uncharacterized protein (DUF697 family)